MKPETTLAEVKTYLRDQFSDGCDCPACGQFVKLYNYKLFATSAWALIQLYKLHEKRPNEAYFHISEYAEAGEGRIRAPHFAELRYWGLIAKMENDDPKKKSSGYWGITDLGRRFVLGKVTVQSRILLFNNQFQGFAKNAEPIKIREALDARFDYQEIMGTQVEPPTDKNVVPGQVNIFGEVVKEKPFNAEELRQH